MKKLLAFLAVAFLLSLSLVSCVKWRPLEAASKGETQVLIEPLNLHSSLELYEGKRVGAVWINGAETRYVLDQLLIDLSNNGLSSLPKELSLNRVLRSLNATMLKDHSLRQAPSEIPTSQLREVHESPFRLIELGSVDILM